MKKRRQICICLLAAVFMLSLAAFWRTGHKTVVLAYHSVSETPFTDSETLFVRPEELREHIRALKNAGFEFIFASEVDPGSLKKRVCLTFDDGYRDNLTELLPILEEFDAKATIFIPWDMLDFNERYLTLEEMMQLAQSPLVEIGAHGKSHRLFMDMTLDEIETEMEEGQRLLQIFSHQKVQTMAYPGGHYSREAAEAAEKYFSRCFTFSGARQYVSFWNRPNLLPRISVWRGTTGDGLLRMIRSARPGRNVMQTY